MRTRTFSARLRQFFQLAAVACLALSGAAGCSSSRSAYQFRAAPGVAAQAAATPGVSVPPPLSKAVEATSGPPRLFHLAAQRPVAQSAAAHRAATKPRLVSRSIAQQQAFAPQHPTEVGLGTTVLGVLGLVVLPLSLLGLLIWGGPVWAVLAGLAALAVLVAYIDPFR
jgi:hypothetical protein